jgi:hypothetical protein
MGVSTLVAIYSAYNTTRLWTKGNRPILSAFVETESSGNVAIMYNLLVINTGNRPALNIYLHLNLEDFKKCIDQNMDMENPAVQAILRCFSIEEAIPLIIDGDKKYNYFGLTSNKPEENIWVYGSSLPIEINYQDLEGNKYISRLTLVIKDSKTFAGTEWSDPT